MRPEASKYLYDMQRAAERVASFCSGATYESYRKDELLQSAVERQFGIIGEALARLRELDPPTAERIPQYRKIIAFRNIIVHGYATVDTRIVWGVVESDLPALRASLEKLLSG